MIGNKDASKQNSIWNKTWACKLVLVDSIVMAFIASTAESCEAIVSVGSSLSSLEFWKPNLSLIWLGCIWTSTSDSYQVGWLTLQMPIDRMTWPVQEYTQWALSLVGLVWSPRKSNTQCWYCRVCNGEVNVDYLPMAKPVATSHLEIRRGLAFISRLLIVFIEERDLSLLQTGRSVSETCEIGG
mgnify:CR=1 FL=1